MYTFAVIAAKVSFQHIYCCVFASETEYKNAAGIWVAGRPGENTACIFLITAKLGTAVWVCESFDTRNAFADVFCESCWIFKATLLTQATVGIIQRSLRIPAEPSERK